MLGRGLQSLELGQILWNEESKERVTLNLELGM
jgi:hypothetical protein